MSLPSLLLSFLLLQSLNVSLSIRTATCTRYRLSTQHWNKFLTKRPKGPIKCSQVFKFVIRFACGSLSMQWNVGSYNNICKKIYSSWDNPTLSTLKGNVKLFIPHPPQAIILCDCLKCSLFPVASKRWDWGGEQIVLFFKKYPIWWQSFNNFVVTSRFSRPNSLVVTQDTNFLRKIIVDLRYGY